MRTSHLVLAAAGVAVAVATGSAFTASNTVPDSVAGYGQGKVSGAVAENVRYVPLSTDNTKLASVVFTLSTDISGQVATMTLKSGGGANDAGTPTRSTPYTCDLGDFTGVEGSGGSMTATCDTTDNPLFSTFDTVGLTVLDAVPSGS